MSYSKEEETKIYRIGYADGLKVGAFYGVVLTALFCSLLMASRNGLI